MKKNIKVHNLLLLKMAKSVCTILCVFSFVFMLFTAGASDMELITASKTVLYTMINIWLLGIGMFGHRVFYVSIIKQRRRIVSEMKNNRLRSGKEIKFVA